MGRNCKICGLRIDIANISSFNIPTDKAAQCIKNTYQSIDDSWTISAGESD